MAAFTLEQAQTKLAEMQTAESAIVNGAQSYTVRGRALSRADLRWVAEQIKYYAGIVNQLSRAGGGIRIRRGIPIDNC